MSPDNLVAIEDSKLPAGSIDGFQAQAVEYGTRAYELQTQYLDKKQKEELGQILTDEKATLEAAQSVAKTFREVLSDTGTRIVNHESVVF